MHLNILFKIFLALIISFNATMALAQSGIEELKKVNKSMQDISNLSTDVIYKVYKNYYSTIAIEETKASVKKSGENLLSINNNQISVKNQKFILFIDKDEKQIFVDNTQDLVKKKKESSSNQADLYSQLDSISKKAKEVRIVKLNESTRKLIVNFGKSDFLNCSKVEVVYNFNTHLINKMILYFNQEISTQDDEKGPKEKPRLEIVLENVSTAQLNTSVFSEAPYVTVVKKSLMLSAAYKDYELIDLRIKK